MTKDDKREYPVSMPGGRPSEYTPELWAVYALHEPTGEVRYVGITKNPEDRVKRHYRECRYGNTHRKAWLRSVFLAGQEPLYSVLEWTTDWNEAERRWIAYFRASGAKLVNGNDGGKTHKGTRIPNPHPCIRNYYRMVDAAARGRFATDKTRENAESLRAIVNRARKQGTLDDLEKRLYERQAAQHG